MPKSEATESLCRVVVVGRSALLQKRYGDRENGQAVILKGKSDCTKKLRRPTQPPCFRRRYFAELQFKSLKHANRVIDLQCQHQTPDLRQVARDLCCRDSG